MHGHESSKTKVALAVLLLGAALLPAAGAFAGNPSVGPDCGDGASIVGSDVAGKVTLGTGASVTGACTVTFSSPGLHAPACTAVNETNGGGNSVTVATRSTSTTVVLRGASPWSDGDVVSYICIAY